MTVEIFHDQSPRKNVADLGTTTKYIVFTFFLFFHDKTRQFKCVPTLCFHGDLMLLMSIYNIHFCKEIRKNIRANC